MTAQFRVHALGLLLLAVVTSATFAQRGPLTPPQSGGAAGVELRQIYSQDVGNDYSAGSLNQLALNNARAQINSFNPTNTASQAPRIGLGLSPNTGVGKPFTGYTPGPTVSPYLNLFREDFGGNSDLNYNTLVQPMLQQQQFNQQVQRQSMEMARRLQSLSAQSDFNPQGSKSQYPTGHQTTFMYYGHYYPSANVRPRR